MHKIQSLIHRFHCISIIKNDWLMQSREKIFVYCENHTKHRNVKFLLSKQVVYMIYLRAWYLKTYWLAECRTKDARTKLVVKRTTRSTGSATQRRRLDMAQVDCAVCVIMTMQTHLLRKWRINFTASVLTYLNGEGEVIAESLTCTFLSGLQFFCKLCRSAIIT